MRGLRLLWGSVVATFLICALFFTLREATAAIKVQAEVQRGAVMSAAQWLVSTHQNDDGGFSSFSAGAGEAPSDAGGTADAILALASAGYNVAASYPGRDVSPVGYLLSNADDAASYAAQGGGANAKLILALTAANRDPRNFGGHDFTISLTQQLSPTGQFNVTTPYEQGLAVLALSVVSDAVPAQAIDWLLARQVQEGEVSGSWDDGFGTDGNVDATAMAVMALVAAGEPVDSSAVAAARAFLLEKQLPDGGWSYAPGLPGSANSTALAIQALSALGDDFYSAQSEWAMEDTTPLSALLAWQGESGAFQADFGDGPADDFFTTVQALPALTGRAYPLPARHEAARRAVACLATMQDATSGGWPEFAGTEANAGGTARAIVALTTFGADLDAERFAVGDHSPLAALEALAPDYLDDAGGGRVGIVMRGAVAAGADATELAGMNLPLRMTEHLSPTGEYDDTSFGPYSHAQAMLGLLAAEQEVDPSALAWLVSAQNDDGSWGSPDATGVSLQVISRIGDGDSSGVVEPALANLRATQQVDGGWGFAFPSSVNSTAEVAQGLVAARENPFDPSWSVVTSGTMRNAADLALMQQGDNGCWPNLFGDGDDPYATSDGIILLSLEPLWGTVPEPQELPEPTPTDDVDAGITPTAEVVVEATRAIPSPTVEPEVMAQPTPKAEATATTVGPEEATPLATTAVDSDSSSTRSVFIWIILALALLVGAMIYFRVTSRR